MVAAMMRRVTASLAVLLSFALPAMAQDFTAIDTSDEGGCTQIHLRLRDAVTYAGASLSGNGGAISIPVEILAAHGDQITAGKNPPIDTANSAGLQSVVLSRSASNSGTITITLAQPVGYRIVMDAETRHIRIDVAKTGTGQACTTGPIDAGAPKDQATDPLAKAFTAVSEGRNEEAIKLLAPLLSSQVASERQKAMELSGLALERVGRSQEARSQYESYLQLYPRDENTARIKQLLNDLVDAMKASPVIVDGKEDLPATLQPKSSDAQNASLADNSASLRGTIAPESTLRSMRKIKEAEIDPEKWKWTKYGSLGQAYYRDDAFDEADGHKLVESEIISNVSAELKGENQRTAISMRVDALNRQDIGINGNERTTSISTFYADILDKQSELSARLGRQLRNDSGIFGRFDGLSAAWKPNKKVKLGIAAGSPVYERDQLPFADSRYFFAANAVYHEPDSPWSGELYAIEQRVGSIVDRRAVGTELSFEAKDIAAYAGLDFDINQGKATGAFLSGNWQANEQTVLTASLDYRTQPFLLTSNALAGQEQDKLPSLVNLLGEKQVLLLANDRTADAVTAALGLSYTFNEQWQLAIDALWSDVSGTPASGGVDELPELANDIYASGFLYGNGIILADDSFGLGLTYTHGETSSRFGTDLSWRFPVDDKLRISSRIRASITTKDSAAIYSIAPSIGARYRIDRNWLLESELGVALRSDETPAELQAFVGYRYEF